MAQWKRIQISIGAAVLACVLFVDAGDDTWIEVKSPNFVVISNASQKQARRTANSLEQFRSLLQAALPKLKMDPGSTPVVFVLRDEKGFKALLPAEALAKSAAVPGGLFLSSPERHFVLLRADAPPELAYHAVYHEYVHLVMRLNFPDLPLWLNEGLAEFFGYARVLEGKSDLGMPSPELLQTLKTGILIPLTTLFEVTHDSPYYREQGKADIFYAQSWALTHFLMVGDKQAHTEQLNAFLKLLQNEVPAKEAAKSSFGDLKNLERKIYEYVRSMTFYQYRIPAQIGIKEEDFSLRTLMPAESLALRGEFLVHVNRLNEARTTLEQAMQLDPRNALANEGMGMLYNSLKDHETAGKYFVAASEFDSRSFLANYFAALAIMDRGDTSAAENYLRKALALNPDFVPALQALSEHLASRQDRMTEALELSRKAIALAPAEMSHRIRTASILAAMGKDDEASALLEKVVAIARSDLDREFAQSLLARMGERRQRLVEAAKRVEERREEIRKMEERRERDRELEAQIRAQRGSGGPSAQSGSVQKILGVIRSVQCDYPAVMDLVLDSNGKLQKLRAQNYYQVQFWAVDAPGKTGFEPCEELEGKRVEIEFMSASEQDYSGLIRAVAIQK